MRALRHLGRLTVLAAGAMLLSGCIKLDMALDIQSDNTVDGSVVFAVDRQVLDFTGQSFDDLTQGQLPTDQIVPGASTKPYEDDDFVGEEITFEGASLDQMSQGSTGPDDLRIERDGDVFRVSGVMDLTEEALGTDSATGSIGGLDPAKALEGAEIEIEMTFPGEVTESTGEVSGNMVRWSPTFGERTEISAVASAVGSGGGIPIWAWVVIGLVVIGVMAVVLMTSRRKAVPVTESPDASGGFVTPEAPTPQPEVPPTPEAPAPPRPESS